VADVGVGVDVRLVERRSDSDSVRPGARGGPEDRQTVGRREERNEATGVNLAAEVGCRHQLSASPDVPEQPETATVAIPGSSLAPRDEVGSMDGHEHCRSDGGERDKVGERLRTGHRKA
jgi:hypothetical protein